MARVRVAVIMGGRSSEHDISVASARSVVDALDPEMVEAALDGSPLRIEDARFGRDIHRESMAAHRAITSSLRYRSKLAPVIRS